MTDDARRVFQEDEMNLRSVDPNWSDETLLQQDGMFFLKDVVKPLGIDPLAVKRRVRQMLADGEDPYETMGARKVWNHWIVRMTAFAPYYRQYLIPRIQRVNPDWDANTLLRQQGLFRISEIAEKLPFNTHQLRYQAKKNPRSRQEFGIWKDEESGLFVVDMAVFSKWVVKLWEQGKRNPAGS